MHDHDMLRLVQDLFRLRRTPTEVADLLTSFATHCTTIGLDRSAERFRAGAALVAANDLGPDTARDDDAAA